MKLSVANDSGAGATRFGDIIYENRRHDCGRNLSGE